MRARVRVSVACSSVFLVSTQGSWHEVRVRVIQVRVRARVRKIATRGQIR